MKNIIAFSVAFAAGAWLTGAWAAPPAAPAAKPGLTSKNCEIVTNADNFVADLNGKTGEFVGNVVITQCDTKLRADKVRIITVNNQADKVNATGNVVVDSPKSGVATGQAGLYDVTHKMVTMTGNVVLKKNKSVLTGQKLVINLVTGEANLGGGVKSTVPGQQGGQRVKAVFSANQQGQ